MANAIEAKCLPISKLVEGTQDWIAKLILIEKSQIWYATDQHNDLQGYVFADAEKNTIEAVVYARDMYQIAEQLMLYQTYYIGNAKIGPMKQSQYNMALSNAQLTLSKATYIRPVTKENALTTECCFPLTQFSELQNFIDNNTAKLNILCSIIHALPPRTLSNNHGDTPIQEFVIVNPEMRPLVLTLWPAYLEVEGIRLIKTAHEKPVILLARPKVTFFNVMIVNAKANTNIIFDPSLLEAKALNIWVKENSAYLDKIIVEKLYDKGHQTILRPALDQVKQITQVFAMPNPMKAFWVKAKIQIANTTQRFYYLECDSCTRPTGALYDMEFNCQYCTLSNRKPKPWLKFEVQLTDQPNCLNATIEEQYAEKVLQLDPLTAYKMQTQGEQIDLTGPNLSLKGKYYYLQMRSYLVPGRAITSIKYNIIAFIEASQESGIFQLTNPVSGQASTSARALNPASGMIDEPLPYPATTTAHPSSSQMMPEKHDPLPEPQQLPDNKNMDPHEEQQAKRQKNIMQTLANNTLLQKLPLATFCPFGQSQHAHQKR